MSYLDESAAQLKIFEGQIPWMYRDSSAAGYCTAATGNLISGVTAAQAMPWQLPDGTPATSDQIADDYNRVMAMPAGLLASHYRIPSSLTLAQDYMDTLLAQRQTSFEGSLRKIYAGYDGQPDGAKKAELDMIFNLGPSKLLAYTHMNASIGRGDYASASQQCARNSSNPAFNARNLWTKNQFRAAAGLDPVAE